MTIHESLLESLPSSLDLYLTSNRLTVALDEPVLLLFLPPFPEVTKSSAISSRHKCRRWRCRWLILYTLYLYVCIYLPASVCLKVWRLEDFTDRGKFYFVRTPRVKCISSSSPPPLKLLFINLNWTFLPFVKFFTFVGITFTYFLIFLNFYVYIPRYTHIHVHKFYAKALMNSIITL